ncbi:glycosyltransferase family 2 protein [Thermogemmatispora sp.]|uniref:glycosyltransferase family 2 protein n=1 Tax=Thermogemmatispora sp. TaxID=1968838 RepID=UPI001D8D5E79|nr:glycosyltransferase [Thermogemmatispora sp.]MBX5449411.1 glycosyltransferase [Thermogemmatispora sp.]
MSLSSLARSDNKDAEAPVRAPILSQAGATAIPRSLSIVLLTQNDEASIELVVRSLLSGLETWADDLEILAVDRGSHDRTGILLERLAAEEPRLIVLHQPASCSYGRVLTSALGLVSKEFVLITEAQPGLDVDLLKRSFTLLSDYDAVLGFRQRQGWSQLTTLLWSWLLRFALGLRVRDLYCPFKLYRAEFFRQQTLEMGGPLINAEMIYKFVRAGYVYTEIALGPEPASKPSKTPLRRKLALFWEALCELSNYSGRCYQEEHGCI